MLLRFFAYMLVAASVCIAEASEKAAFRSQLLHHKLIQTNGKQHVPHIARAQASSTVMKSAKFLAPPSSRLQAEFRRIKGLKIANFFCGNPYEAIETLTQMHAKLIDSSARQNVQVYLFTSASMTAACQLSLSRFTSKTVSRANYPGLEIIELNTGGSMWFRDHTVSYLSDNRQRTSSPAVLPLAWGWFHDDAIEAFQKLQSLSVTNATLLQSSFEVEGGNLIADSNGVCVSSARVLLTNNMSEQEVSNLYANVYGCKKTIILEMLPYEMTRHVDLFFSFAAEKTILLGMYSQKAGNDSFMVTQANRNKLKRELPHYRIVEVPMPSFCPVDASGKPTDCAETLRRECPFDKMKSQYNGGPECSLRSLSKCNSYLVDSHFFSCVYPFGHVSRSHLNMFYMNGEVHVPTYAEDSSVEQGAIRVIQSAIGVKRIITHQVDAMAKLGGSLHCVTKEIPVDV